MSKSQPIKTSANRTKVIEEFTKAMNEDGAPAELTELWKTQSGLCYCAFLTGPMTARQMCLEGHIAEDQVTEVAMEWAKLLVMKISYTPVAPPPPSSGIVIPKVQRMSGHHN